MSENVDVVVIGMGPGGEVVAGELAKANRRVVVIERELIGGECAYYACIPSKVVLRAPALGQEVDHAAGITDARLSWEKTRTYRDQMARHWDDSTQVDSYEGQGVTVVKGEGRIVKPGVVAVGGREFVADHIVIATGTQAHIPAVDGLDTVPVWTTRELYTAQDLPDSAVIVGGSAVAVEAATFLARFGVNVTVVHRGSRILSREEPQVSDLVSRHLEAVGVEVKVNVEPAAVERSDTGRSVIHLNDGTALLTDVIVFATGRTPRTGTLGADTAGVTLGDRGQILVDDQCHAAPGVWAVGDVTGIMPYTHVAKYQGRIVADAILGRPRRATYTAIPRVVFGDPEIAAVGLTAQQARDQGINSVENTLDLTEALAKPWLDAQTPHGVLGVVADADNRVLVGAWAVGLHASEWIHWAAFAIRTRTPVDVLLDQVVQFPTYHEAYLSVIGGLDLR